MWVTSPGSLILRDPNSCSFDCVYDLWSFDEFAKLFGLYCKRDFDLNETEPDYVARIYTQYILLI